MTESLQHPCFYCGFLPAADKPINGLDRVDSALKEYSTANTVPCCAACNHIKAAYTVDFFMHQVKSIATHSQNVQQTTADIVDQAYRQQCSRNYPSVEKVDELTPEQHMQLWAKPCVLCGHGPAMGIDRLDAAQGYVQTNCQSCCGPCNYMKSAVSLPLFLSKIRDIFAVTAFYTLGEITQISTQPGRMISPVAVFVGSEVVARFPSCSSAARIMGVSIPTISSAIGKSFRGGEWRNLDVADYINSAPIPADIVEEYLKQSQRQQSIQPSQPKKARQERRGTEVKLRDETGEVSTFSSQSKAAGFLGCTQAAVSKAPIGWQYKSFTKL